VVSEPPVQRRRRPVALIALAVFVIGAAGAAYLRPAPPTQRPTTALTVDPSLVTNNPVTYAFITPSLGWASLIAGQEFRVFRTVDGARHWQQQIAAQSGRGNGFDPLEIQFFGKTRGFMIVGQPVERIYRTTDGGEHWDPLVFSAVGIDAITFSDATHGWMVGYMGPRLPPTQPQTYATSDGGQTWQPLPDPPADAGILRFRSPSDAWMGSVDLLLPHVYTSGDGGQSWQRHDLPRAVGSLPDDRYFQTTVQLLPGAGAVATLEAVRCTVTLPSPSFVPVGGPSPPPLPQCVNAISETFQFMSTDGGATWRQLASPPGTVVYQDSVHWWSTNPNALFKSADAGRSWKQVAAIPPNLQFSVVGILDPKHAWASMFVMGGYGLALTHDGGLHWTLARVPAPA
jgi:photosystem II stability/assembly factor-like uncharacterized protein